MQDIPCVRVDTPEVLELLSVSLLHLLNVQLMLPSEFFKRSSACQEYSSNTHTHTYTHTHTHAHIVAALTQS